METSKATPRPWKIRVANTVAAKRLTGRSSLNGVLYIVGADEEESDVAAFRNSDDAYLTHDSVNARTKVEVVLEAAKVLLTTFSVNRQRFEAICPRAPKQAHALLLAIRKVEAVLGGK